MDKKAVIVLGLVGIAVIAALATGGYFVSEDWEDSTNGQLWAPVLAAAEEANGIPTGLLSRIAYQESSFSTSIINGTQSSSAGALGIMQLEPEYFSTVQVPVPFSAADTTAQISQAAAFLASLYSQFGNWTQAVAAYNAGAGTIQSVLAGSAQLPTETANYIADVSASLPNIVSPTLQGSDTGGTMSPGGTAPGGTGGTQTG